MAAGNLNRHAPMESFEVLVEVRPGRWENRGIFGDGGGPQAIERAHALEGQGGGTTTRVIREIYDPASKEASAIIVYQTPRPVPAGGDAPAEPMVATLKEFAAAPSSAPPSSNIPSSHLSSAERSDEGPNAPATPAPPAAPETRASVRRAPPRGPAALSAAAAERKVTSGGLITGFLRWLVQGAGQSERATGGASADNGGQGATREKEVTPHTAAHRQIAAFLRDSHGVLHRLNRRNDTFQRFGACFFITGACEQILKEAGVEGENALQFIAETLGVLQIPMARALTFAREHERHLMESDRYAHMFQAGYAAMSAFKRDGVRSADSLKAALAAWEAFDRDARASCRRPYTLMFSDIVGSSAIALEKGDLHALQLLRIHKQVVQSVLGQYGGTLIKCLGDGMLASFTDSVQALTAASVIQRVIREHNDRFRDAPLHLRIGLNVGETIAEAGDLFGASVNLASHVCAAAEPDQILCTGIVRRRAEGSSVNFVPLGPVTFKGWKEPIPLFRIAWEQGLAPAAIDGEAVEDEAVDACGGGEPSGEVLPEPRHELDEIARPVAGVQLVNENFVPGVAARAG